MIGILFLCAWYIAISAVLINYNKFLMNPEHFPYGAPLMSFQMAVTLVCCLVVYGISPSSFPAMDRALGNMHLIMKYFPFIGVLFIVGVVCSNQAYIYCNVAFLQFMKEWNIALVFFFSVLTGSQILTRVKFAVVLWIIAAACTAITGDMTFSHLGFMIQLCSQLGETSKTVFQEFILGGSDLKLDPLTYTLFMMPITTIVLGVFNFATWTPEMTVGVKKWWPYLIGNGFCAFLLNVTIATVIKRAGAMAFILSGLVKDVVIVCTASYIANYPLDVQQTVGFTFALLGIGYWGLMGKIPTNPFISWLPRLVGGPSEPDGSKEEKQSLLPTASQKC